MSQIYQQLNKIGILHRSNEAPQPKWRRDDVYKLIVGLNGPIVYETPLSKLHIGTGQFLVFNPGDKHQQVRCAADKFLLEFSPTLVNEVASEVMGKSTVDLQFRQAPVFHRDVAKITDMLITELAEPRSGQQIMLEHSALQLFVLAVRSTQLGFSDVVSRLDKPSVQRAVSMLMDCYRDAVTLEDIARSADMNKFSLIRQFRQTMGLTPYEWLQHFRLQRACEDLIQTKRMVLEIALDHGFQSLSSFNRAFRRVYGMSPTQWRKLHE